MDIGQNACSRPVNYPLEPERQPVRNLGIPLLDFPLNTEREGAKSWLKMLVLDSVLRTQPSCTSG
jgi:hypothetical protein